MPTSIICAGNATWDRIWRVSRLPHPGEKIRSQGYMETGGGQAANAAVNATALAVPAHR